jgi:hypothetical protein
LNSFANQAENKIHDLDEKLDELEALICLFESKLDAIPEKMFEFPPLPEAEDEM